MSEHESPSGWKKFWERGGWWRAALLAAVYYGVYQLLYLLIQQVFPAGGEARGAEGSALDVFLGLALPIILASITLVIFALSLGWLQPLFAAQPVRGRGWMWIGIAVVLAINISALLSIDYAAAGPALVASWLFTGLFVGFAEETLTRGFAVNLLRKAGHGEISVALISSAIFALLHFGNVFTTNQGLVTTLIQVVYTFAFGLIMYLALRLTGRLLWPILIHASTDPTLSLVAAHPNGGPLSPVVTFSSYLVIATGAVMLVTFIVSERRRAKTGLSAGAAAL